MDRLQLPWRAIDQGSMVSVMPTTRSAPRSARPRPLSLDPVAIRRRCKAAAYRIMAKHSGNRSACRRIADEIAAEIAAGWIALVRQQVSTPSAAIAWYDIHIVMYGGMTGITPGIGQPSSAPQGSPPGDRQVMASGSAGGSVSMDRPGLPSPAPHDGITRQDILPLLRSLLARAADGDVGVGDSVRLTEAISRLEGLQSQAKQDIVIQPILYDSP